MSYFCRWKNCSYQAGGFIISIQDCRLHFITPSSLTSTRGVPKPFQQSTSCFVVFFNFHQLTWASSRRCLKLKNPVPINRDRVCAQNRNRTCTSLRTLDFESSASTNSAIWAGMQYYVINENLPKYDLGIFSCSNILLFAALLLG